MSASSRNKQIAKQISSGISPSSAIGSIKYKPDTEDLIVKFVNGGKYEYADVPEDVSDNFEDASSLGKFFNKKIKPNYAYNKVG